MNNKEFRSMWLSSILLTLVISLPIFFASSDPLVRYVITLICDLVILWYFGSRLGKAGAFDKENQEMNTKHLLLLLPLCVVFLPPLLGPIFSQGQILITYTNYFWLELLGAFLIAVIDEMFFRMIIFNRFKNERNRLLKIVKCALIFGAFEMISPLLSFAIFSAITSFVTGFILGLFLGFIIEYTHCIYPCMAFHFLYTLTHETIYSVFIDLNGISLILNIVTVIIALIYLALIYVFYFIKREDVNNVF